MPIEEDRLGLGQTIINKLNIARRFKETMRDVVNDELEANVPRLVEDALEKPSGTFMRVSKEHKGYLTEIRRSTRTIESDVKYIKKAIVDLEKKNNNGLGLLGTLLAGAGIGALLWPLIPEEWKEKIGIGAGVVAGAATAPVAAKLGRSLAKIGRGGTRVVPKTTPKITPRLPTAPVKTPTTPRTTTPPKVVLGPDDVRTPKAPVLRKIFGKPGIATRTVGNFGNVFGQFGAAITFDHFRRTDPKFDRDMTMALDDLWFGTFGGRPGNEVDSSAFEEFILEKFPDIDPDALHELVRGFIGDGSNYERWKRTKQRQQVGTYSQGAPGNAYNTNQFAGNIYGDYTRNNYDSSNVQRLLDDRKKIEDYEATNGPIIKPNFIPELPKVNNPYHDPKTLDEGKVLIIITKDNQLFLGAILDTLLDLGPSGYLGFYLTGPYAKPFNTGPSEFVRLQLSNIGGMVVLNSSGVQAFVKKHEEDNARTMSDGIARTGGFVEPVAGGSNVILASYSGGGEPSIPSGSGMFSPYGGMGGTGFGSSLGSLFGSVGTGSGERRPTLGGGTAGGSPYDGGYRSPSTGNGGSFSPAYQTADAKAARANAEKYLGKPISDEEWSMLIRATYAEAGRGKDHQLEEGMIMASILNRAREEGGIRKALYRRNQFQSVTGAPGNRNPHPNFVNGPSEKYLASILGSTTFLEHISHEQKDFTAASDAAYGPGTNIKYRDDMLAGGGATIGGSVFRTSPNLPDNFVPTLNTNDQNAIPSGDPRFLNDPSKFNVHPAIVESMEKASQHLPEGYAIKFNSGARNSSTVSNSYHVRRDSQGRATAMDISIMRQNENGEWVALPNIRSPENFEAYRTFMQDTKYYQDELYPEMASQGRWGGYFVSGVSQDLMHYDLGSSSVTAAGNWQQGLYQKYAYYGAPGQVGQGMGTDYVPKPIEYNLDSGSEGITQSMPQELIDHLARKIATLEERIDKKDTDVEQPPVKAPVEPKVVTSRIDSSVLMEEESAAQKRVAQQSNGVNDNPYSYLIPITPYTQ